MSVGAEPPPERMLRQGDRLLRKLIPDTWNTHTLEVFPEAFQDKHEDLSLFVARMSKPRDILALFEKFGSVREQFFGNRKRRSLEEMWERGFGIGVIGYDAIKALGLEFKKYDDGTEIEEDGHVEVKRGKECMLELSAQATALARTEVFPPSNG